MGLIHVLSEVPEDEPKCLINFTNPLLDTTKPFTIKLLRIFTKANDNLKKNIPVKVIVNDSPFLVSTNFTIPVETETIANATNRLVTTLKIDRFKNQLLKFQDNPPNVTYNALTSNDTANERFFNLNTSKNTYLFSNNKYILYMLGYDDSDMQKITNLTVDGNEEYFKKFLQETRPLLNLRTIYVVKHDISSIQPRKRRTGNIKWHVDDTVKSVFFASKRRNR